MKNLIYGEFMNLERPILDQFESFRLNHANLFFKYKKWLGIN